MSSRIRAVRATVADCANYLAVLEKIARIYQDTMREMSGRLHMDRQIVNTLGCFHHRFTNCRMRMHDAAEFVGGRFESHADACFCKKLGGVWTNDVDAKNLVVFLFRDDLDETVGLAEYSRFARS